MKPKQERRLCEICGKEMQRPQFPSGKFKALSRWTRQQFCSPKCIGEAKWRDARLRIAKKVRVDQITGCWNWIGAIDRDGYGQLRFHYRRWKAHRFAYATLVGSVPPRLHLDHLPKQTLLQS